MRKELVVGPIKAYRAWYYFRDESNRLRSLYANYFWEERPVPAGHLGRSDLGMCDDLDCICGYHTVRTLDQLDNLGLISSITGEVLLWGRVISGPSGYRSEYAHPIKIWKTEKRKHLLFVPTDNEMLDLSHRYGCEFLEKPPSPNNEG